MRYSSSQCIVTLACTTVVFILYIGPDSIHLITGSPIMRDRGHLCSLVLPVFETMLTVAWVTMRPCVCSTPTVILGSSIGFPMCPRGTTFGQVASVTRLLSGQQGGAHGDVDPPPRPYAALS